MERTRSFSRLEMVRSLDAAKKFVEGTITLHEQTSGRSACIEELAYLKVVGFFGHTSALVIKEEILVLFTSN